MTPAKRIPFRSKRARPANISLLAMVLAGISCSHLQGIIEKPHLSLAGMSVTEVSLTGMAMGFDVEVENPNPFGLSLSSLGYDLKVEGRQVATGTNKTGLEVPSKGKGTVRLPVAFRFKDVAETVHALFTKNEAAFGLDTKLGFSTPAGEVVAPLGVQGKVPLPKLPQVSIGQARVSRVDFRGAAMEVGLGLKNPNTFPLPLGKLAYRVLIDGTSVAQGDVAGGNLTSGGASELTIPVQVSFLDAAPALITALQKGKASVKLDGDLDFGGGKMPLSLLTSLVK